MTAGAQAFPPYCIYWLPNLESFNTIINMMAESKRLTIAEQMALYRERKVAAGGRLVNIYLPAHLVELVDQMKEAQGVPGRAPIIAKALEDYFTKINPRT